MAMPVEHTNRYFHVASSDALRAAVVYDAGGAERGGLHEDPRHGHVVGEVNARDCGGEHHQQGEVYAVGLQVVVPEVALRVQGDEGGHHGHQQVEEGACGVEGEESARRGAVESPAEEHGGEGGVHGEVQRAEQVYRAAAACEERGGGSGGPQCEEEVYHCLVLLRVSP